MSFLCQLPWKHTHTARLTMDCSAVTLQAWPWSPDTLAMATWVAAEAGEHDALATLTQASRGLLVTQALQPAAGGMARPPASVLGSPAGPGALPQQQQSGFTDAGGAGMMIVKSEPMPIWQPGEGLAQFAGSSDGMDMQPGPGVGGGELPSFDLGTSLDALGEFDPAMPIGSLDMPAAHPF